MTFLSPPEENGERHRAKVSRKVVEIIDQENGHRVENINFILDIANHKVEEWIAYDQLLEHLKTAQDNDMGMDQECFEFRVIIGHQGPLASSNPANIIFKWNGRLGRLLLNLSQLLLLITQSPVQHMPNNMIYLL